MQPTVDLSAQRTRIRAALLATPVESNRTIARRIGCHHVTVGTVRKLLESTGEISKVDKTVGADGKAYSRQPIKVKTQEPPSLDEQVAEATAPLVQAARTNGRRDELIGALRALLDRLAGDQPHVKDVQAPNVIEPEAIRDGDSADIQRETIAEEIEPTPGAGVSDGPEIHPVIAEPVGKAQWPPAASVPRAHVRPLRDVMRDITPSDAPNSSYAVSAEGVEERLADVEEAEEYPPVQLAPATPREGNWILGTVAYINAFTQCGRVYFPKCGDLQFSDRTPREAGLVLRRGLEVDCRFVERHGHPWIVELARPAA
jgi:hypothetical protein